MRGGRESPSPGRLPPGAAAPPQRPPCRSASAAAPDSSGAEVFAERSAAAELRAWQRVAAEPRGCSGPSYGKRSLGGCRRQSGRELSGAWRGEGRAVSLPESPLDDSEGTREPPRGEQQLQPSVTAGHGEDLAPTNKSPCTDCTDQLLACIKKKCSAVRSYFGGTRNALAIPSGTEL